MEEKVATLDNLNGGAAIEMFEAEMQRVLANIADFNTEPRAKREIVLTVKITPSDDRRMGSVEITAASKLAPQRGVESAIFFGKIQGQLAAVQQDPEQGALFGAPMPGLKSVV